MQPPVSESSGRASHARLSIPSLQETCQKTPPMAATAVDHHDDQGSTNDAALDDFERPPSKGSLQASELSALDESGVPGGSPRVESTRIDVQLANENIRTPNFRAHSHANMRGSPWASARVQTAGNVCSPPPHPPQEIQTDGSRQLHISSHLLMARMVPSVEHRPVRVRRPFIRPSQAPRGSVCGLLL